MLRWNSEVTDTEWQRAKDAAIPAIPATPESVTIQKNRKWGIRVKWGGEWNGHIRASA